MSGSFLSVGLTILSLLVLMSSTHMHDLKEVTSEVHYENFRISRIRQQQHDPTAKRSVEREKLFRISS